MSELFRNHTLITKQLTAEIFRQAVPMKKRILFYGLTFVLQLTGWIFLYPFYSLGLFLLSVSTGLSWLLPLLYAVTRHKMREPFSRETVFYDPILVVTYRDSTSRQTSYALIRRILDYGQWIVLATKEERIVLSKNGFSGVDYSSVTRFLQEKTGISRIQRRFRFPARLILAISLTLLLAVAIAMPDLVLGNRHSESASVSEQILDEYDQHYNHSSGSSAILTRSQEENDTFRLYSCTDMDKLQPAVLYAAYLADGRWEWRELDKFPSQEIEYQCGCITVYSVRDNIVLVMTGFEGKLLTDTDGVRFFYDFDTDARPIHDALVILPAETVSFCFYMDGVLQTVDVTGTQELMRFMEFIREGDHLPDAAEKNLLRD